MCEPLQGDVLTMDRRQIVRTGAVGAVAATLSRPALAQSLPEVKWRLTSSFPKSLDTLFGATEFLARRVAQMTDNRFQIRTFAAGEIVPPLQALDAVQNGTVECAQTAPYYYIGKDATFAFGTAVPFGLNTRQHTAWLRHGGGQELMEELYRSYNTVAFQMGHTGAQMGGWFRKEIKSLDDLKGLKMRIAGFAGQVMQKLGVLPQQLAAGEVYAALEKGTIDAMEFVGPYDDQKLGIAKVAPFYHYPAWWEGGAALSLFVNLQAFEALPESYRAILQAACTEATEWTLAKYDALNPRALRELVAGGTKLVPFPAAVLEASFAAAKEVFAETAAANPRFKKVHDSYMAFRAEEVLWFRVAENGFDTFMARQSAGNRL
jgi:TRAP-type mannitol/chloroaromatic compound transport system substrate-binding protein